MNWPLTVAPAAVPLNMIGCMLVKSTSVWPLALTFTVMPLPPLALPLPSGPPADRLAPVLCQSPTAQAATTPPVAVVGPLVDGEVLGVVVPVPDAQPATTKEDSKVAST